MKKALSLLLAFALAAGLAAQSGQFVLAPIIVQSGTTAKTATTLDEALNIASPGDLIFLPGGDFFLNAAIGKQVHIYGVGWRSDSAAATGPTRIHPSIQLDAGASGGSLNGVYVQGDILNSPNQNLTAYRISRCRTMSLGLANQESKAFQLDIENSVIRYVNFYSGTLNMSNSILEQRFFCTGNSTLNLDQCILFHNIGYELFKNISAVNLSNSIVFQSSTNSYYFGDNIGFWDFKNSLFVGNPNGLIPGLNGYQGNVVKDLSFRPLVFVNYPGAISFQDNHDFHLKPACAECVGKGIYAGATPYFDVPENPYFTQRSVSVSADGKTLSIKATVNKGKN